MKRKHWLLLAAFVLLPAIAAAVVPAARMTGAQISPQTTCPVASGSAGIWNNSGAFKIRNSGGTDSPIVNGTPAATGDTPYSTSGGAGMSFVSDVAVGSYYRSGGVGAAPLWSTLTVPNACTTGDIFYCSSSNAEGNLADVAVGQVLGSGGVGAAFSWQGSPLLTVPSSTATGHGPIAIYTDANMTGSATSGAITISSFAMPASTLSVNGQTLHYIAFYQHSGTSNTCQMSTTFGGTTTGSISGAVANSSFRLEIWLTRVTSSSVNWASFSNAGGTIAANAGTIGSLTFTSSITIVNQFSAATTANSDCTGAGFRVDWNSN